MARRAKIIRFPGAPDPATEGGFVEVCRCDQPEALVIKSLFESEGIPTRFRSRISHSVHPFSVGAQGEIVILVPEAEAPRSRRLLTLARSRPATVRPSRR